MKGYRVVVFLDMEDAECTEDAVLEMQHAIRSYEEDQPRGIMSLSSVTPME